MPLRCEDGPPAAAGGRRPLPGFHSGRAEPGRLSGTAGGGVRAGGNSLFHRPAGHDPDRSPDRAPRRGPALCNRRMEQRRPIPAAQNRLVRFFSPFHFPTGKLRLSVADPGEPVETGMDLEPRRPFPGNIPRIREKAGPSRPPAPPLRPASGGAAATFVGVFERPRGFAAALYRYLEEAHTAVWSAFRSHGWIRPGNTHSRNGRPGCGTSPWTCSTNSSSFWGIPSSPLPGLPSSSGW